MSVNTTNMSLFEKIGFALVIIGFGLFLAERLVDEAS